MDQRTPKELRNKIEQTRRLASQSPDQTTQARLLEFLRELEVELDSHKKA